MANTKGSEDGEVFGLKICLQASLSLIMEVSKSLVWRTAHKSNKREGLHGGAEQSRVKADCST